MNATALTLSLLLSNSICYHPGIFYPGGSDAVCNDEDTMRGRAVVLSLGLTGVAGGMAYQMPSIEARPVEARLMGGAAHVPCKTKEDASDLIPDVECGKRRRPAPKVPSPPPPDQATRGPGAADKEEAAPAIELGALLADGQVDKLSREVRQYERNTKANPEDAGQWSDFAAIYLTRATTADNPRDLLRAYGAASRALEKDESLLEPRFNKALALERLFLPDAARVAWQDYLDHDRTSGWAEEARRKLREARSQAEAVSIWSEQRARLRQAAIDGNESAVNVIVDQYRQAAREDAEQELFGDWGEAVLAGKDRVADNHLRVLRAVGISLARTSGELLVHDSVAAIDEARNAGDDRRLNEIAQGARDFRDGYKAYKDRFAERAESKLTAARDTLRGANCALAWRAAFFLVSNDYVSRKYPATVAGAGRLARQIETEKLSYGALLAHAYWIKGMAESTLGQTRESIADLKKSFEGFKRLGESENAANIDCRLGEVLMSRGRKSEAWRFIYRALRSTPTLRDPGQAATAYMIAGNAALQDGFDDAALVFQEERVRQSLLDKDNFLAQVEALTSLARFQHHRGDDTGAQASLQEARRLVGEVEARQQPRRQADLAMIEGMILEEKAPDQAAELLTSALPTYQNEKNVVFSLWTHLARGRAYRQARNVDQAEQDFEAALAHYGKMGERLGSEDLRLALLEETDSVFDEMVDLHADLGDTDKSFAYADRARTRVLPGSASKLWTGLPDETNRLLATELQSLTLDEIRRRLPEGVTLVQYSVLRDSVLIWTLRRSGENEIFSRQRISRSALEEKVVRLWAFDTPDGDRAAQELFDFLIQPWLPSVPANEKERIVLIPDKVLHLVPFNALRNGDKRLIETHTLAFAPSATLYVNALERQGSKPPNGSQGLVVGEPAIDHSVDGNEILSGLPAAKKEAEGLASRTGAKKLVGAKATEADFRAAALQAEWIQFSGHAVIDPANTLLSKLVLAPGKNGDNDNGALTAREIYSLKLNGTRLVVLSACDTGNEYVPGGEGVTSLARAFLAAGVPTVVASLWSVDDKATARLFEYFHSNYQKSGDPVIALREAQLKMLHTPNNSSNKKDRSPWAWAAFEVIGASADDQP